MKVYQNGFLNDLFWFNEIDTENKLKKCYTPVH